MSRARCYEVKLPSGEQVRVRADKAPTPEAIEALGEVVEAVKRRLEGEGAKCFGVCVGCACGERRVRR